MSGNIGFGNNLTPVFVDAIPTEGSKTCFIKAYWAQTFTGDRNQAGIYTINLLQQFQTNQFTAIQAVYIDNSSCPYQVSLKCNDTQFVVVIPPFTQGMYPLLSSSAPTFTATLNWTTDQQSGLVYINCTTTFHFLNSPQGRYEFQLPSYGNNFGNATGIINFTNLANANLSGLSRAYWNSVTLVLPSQGANTFYLIKSLQINLSQAGDFAGSSFSNNELILIEAPSTQAQSHTPPDFTYPVRSRFLFSLYEDGSLVQVGNGLNAAAQLIFDPPVLTSTANGQLGFLLTSQPPVIGPLPDGSGFIQFGYTICYGTIVIQ